MNRIILLPILDIPVFSMLIPKQLHKNMLIHLNDQVNSNAQLYKLPFSFQNKSANHYEDLRNNG